LIGEAVAAQDIRLETQGKRRPAAFAGAIRWALAGGAGAATFGLVYGAVVGAAARAAGDPAGPLDYAVGGAIFGAVGGPAFGLAAMLLATAMGRTISRGKVIVAWGLLGALVFGALAAWGLTEPDEPRLRYVGWVVFGGASGLLFGMLSAVFFQPRRSFTMPESKPSDDIVRLATAGDPQEAHLWRQALEGEGIRCHVVGEYLGSFGVAPPGHPVPEVWVLRRDAERARQILDQVQHAGHRGQ
jgi:Putative prokaryotic signal transducing protein